jgi:VCBS repeat-containing protein
VTLNPDGSFVYTPAADYNGSDSFTYKAHDGALDSAEATVALTVSPVNDAPVATNDSYSTNEDVPLTVAAAGVLSNDSDVDHDALSAVLVSNPAHGTVTLNPDGSFVYTPAADYNGSDSFTYKAHDGALDSAEATVAITVSPVNDAPVAANDSYSTNEDVPLTVAAPGVLGNDSDVEHAALSAVLVSNPAHGTVTLNPDGSFVYTPAADYNGSDSFTYKAQDGLLDSAEATVALTVSPVNDAPVAASEIYSTDQDVPLTVAAPGVLRNDADVDRDALTAVLVRGPVHGAVTLHPDGSFSYVPAAAFVGVDGFSYHAHDGLLDSQDVTVTLTVNPTVGSTKFIVVDDWSRDAYQYDAAGGLVGSHDLHREDQRPRGVAANKDGSLYWVVDGNARVFVYNEAGQLVGSWKAKGISKPEGIATDGTHLWIVDREVRRVFYFADAASRRSGEARPTWQFPLHRENRNPMDMTTDGVHLWVVNDTRSVDKVFRYTVRGRLDGIWSIDSVNSQPTGLTVDPNDVRHVWIVDSASDRVYQYDGAAAWATGKHLASTSFALAAANRNPQGIADPRPRTAPVVTGVPNDATFALWGARSNNERRPEALQGSTSAKSSPSDAERHADRLTARRIMARAERSILDRSSPAVAARTLRAHDEALCDLIAEGAHISWAGSIEDLVEQ